MRARTRARLDSSFVFKARARLVCIFSSSSLARARLIYYLLISILNKNNINNRLFRLASLISEARTRARLLIKLIFRFDIRL
ncbi:hypothetical protein Hanom_Chr02g00099401 [Helianthus anomalus]